MDLDEEMKDFKNWLDSFKDENGNINIDEYPEVVRAMKILEMLPYTKEEIEIREQVRNGLGEICSFDLSAKYISHPQD
jgi:hypothetical protein